DARVVVLSAYEDQSTVLEMLDAGAIAYQVKGSPESEILEAIRRAFRGQLSLTGDLGGVLVRELVQEIEERRLSEATLRRSDARFQALLQAAPEAMVITGPSGAIELVNARCERLFGYRARDLVGRPIELLVPEGFQTAFGRHRGGHGAGRRSSAPGAAHDLMGRRRDGTAFRIDVSFSPLVTAEGSKAVAAIRDVSQRRAAEAVDWKSDERFRELLESAPDAMVIVDESGLIQLVNARTEELFGYDRQALIGKTVDLLLPDRLRDVHAAHRAGFLANPRPRPMAAGLEPCGKRLDGTEFPVDINLSTLETGTGTLMVAAIRDVSERKLDELQLAYSVELAERQRAFSQLVRAQEEERRRIASDIHDDTIQTMTAASLRLQQLRRHLSGPLELDLLTKLEHAVHESIVRLRRLMFDLRPPALDRSGLAPALRDLMDRLEEDTGLLCVLHDELLAEPPPDARISLYRIAQQALTNVRMHAQAKRVDVDLSRRFEGSLVKVGDDGVGFEGGESAALPGHLGLVMMRERARMAGGWLRLESTPGAGTKIEFWVPDVRALDLLPAARGDD
ncbi:MAG: PAS domain S-box protein, partial [Chloroflexota bacterium]